MTPSVKNQPKPWSDNLAACLTKHDKKRLVKEIEAAVKETFGRGSVSASPVPQRYPCESFSFWFWMSIDFPKGVDDSYDADNKETTYAAIAPHVERMDSELKARLESFGIRDYQPKGDGWGEHNGMTLAVCFPPNGFSNDEHETYAKTRYRPMTDEELKAYIAEYGHEPFSDEYWICTRWSGVNIFRSARYVPFQT